MEGFSSWLSFQPPKVSTIKKGHAHMLREYSSMCVFAPWPWKKYENKCPVVKMDRSRPQNTASNWVPGAGGGGGRFGACEGNLVASS